MRDLWIYKIQQVINMNPNNTNNITSTTGSSRRLLGQLSNISTSSNSSHADPNVINNVFVQPLVPPSIIEEEISSELNNNNNISITNDENEIDSRSVATTTMDTTILPTTNTNNDSVQSSSSTPSNPTISSSSTTYCGWETDTFMNVTSSVYTNVPSSLAQTIRDKIQHYLAIVDYSKTTFGTTTTSSTNTNRQQQKQSLIGISNWKELSTKTKSEHVHLQLKAYQCDYDPFIGRLMSSPNSISINNNNNNNSTNKKYVLIQSTIQFPYPAKQVFHLIIDSNRRKQYETNIRHAQRIQQYNPHTYIDYYASNAVWPTAAREFVGMYTS
jgi:hypothetical protein